jgi:hypothetical protein
VIGLFDEVEAIYVNDYMIKRIDRNETEKFILEIHYAKRYPSISYAYGLHRGNELIGVITYGSPPSPSLCVGIAGEKNKGCVIELNRLVLKYNEKNQASILISSSFKLLPQPKIIVSYADTEQSHIGVVYQATNFMYTGLSDKRTEWRKIGTNLHSKTVCEMYSLDERKNKTDEFEVIDRPRKHRYVYIIGNKRDKKRLRKEMIYKEAEYPKGRVGYAN